MLRNIEFSKISIFWHTLGIHDFPLSAWQEDSDTEASSDSDHQTTQEKCSDTVTGKCGWTLQATLLSTSRIPPSRSSEDWLEKVDAFFIMMVHFFATRYKTFLISEARIFLGQKVSPRQMIIKTRSSTHDEYCHNCFCYLVLIYF